MADIKQDLLSLQYSSNFQIEGIEEANIDLELSSAKTASATVYGVVTDGAKPIPNATVKLFDSKGMPFKHTLTDNFGAYSLTDIPAGTYSVAAVAEGYRLSDAAGVTLASGTTIQADLVCNPDITLNLGTIAGTLTTTKDGKVVPLADAKITLRNINGENIASTYTANDGEFAFYDLADGTYTLISSADGYLPSSSMTAVVANGSIVNISMSMIADSRTYSGTVSGIIRNKNGQAVSGCFVGLYQINDGEDVMKEKLIAVTKTNDAGKYLFGNVAAGNYIVKAKMEI